MKKTEDLRLEGYLKARSLIDQRDEVLRIKILDKHLLSRHLSQFELPGARHDMFVQSWLCSIVMKWVV